MFDLKKLYFVDNLAYAQQLRRLRAVTIIKTIYLLNNDN